MLSTLLSSFLPRQYSKHVYYVYYMCHKENNLIICNYKFRLQWFFDHTINKPIVFKIILLLYFNIFRINVVDEHHTCNDCRSYLN